MQARIAKQLEDPIMRGLAYGVGGGYVAMSFIYSLTNKEHVKAEPAPAKKPSVAADHSHPVASVAAVGGSSHHDDHHASPAAAAAATKQQVAPVLQQLQVISDRLTKIEKALGI
jgi:hypothetical protein